MLTVHMKLKVEDFREWIGCWSRHQVAGFGGWERPNGRCRAKPRTLDSLTEALNRKSPGLKRDEVRVAYDLVVYPVILELYLDR